MKRITERSSLVIGASIIVSRADRSDLNASGVITAIDGVRVSFSDPLSGKTHQWMLADMGIEPYSTGFRNPFWSTYLLEKGTTAEPRWEHVYHAPEVEAVHETFSLEGALRRLGF